MHLYYNFYIFFLIILFCKSIVLAVAATSLTMSGEPEVGEWVEEGTTVVVECVTDEGNPTPQVTWTRDEANLDPLTESVQNFEVAGRYNSNIRRSVLIIQVIILS